MRHKSQTVSGILITHNSAPWLEQSLASLTWVDECLVVDCGSTDQTLDLARRYDARVCYCPEKNLAAIRRYALGLGACEWLLLLSPGETVSHDLRQEIEGTLLNTPANVNGFQLRRRMMLGSKWLTRPVEPAETLDLVRRNTWRVNHPWHGGITVEGESDRLSQPVDIPAPISVTGWFDAINRRSSLAAGLSLEQHGVQASPGMMGILWRTKWRMFCDYWLSGAFRHGLAGLLPAVGGSLETFLTGLKVRQLSGGDPH